MGGKAAFGATKPRAAFLGKMTVKKLTRKAYKKLVANNGKRATAGKQLDDDSADVIRAAIGEDAVLAATIIAEAAEVSEFKIVQKAELDIQAVRNILYKLHNLNLANYKRIKDNKKGIYVSYWTFNKDAVKELAARLQQEKLQKFKERLEVETSNVNGFFICPAACTRADFARAEQHRFRCEECGQLLAQEDNTRTIDVLREKIREIEAVSAA